MTKRWHLHTTKGRELTAQAEAETEAEAIAPVKDRLEPGERVNETWMDPADLKSD